VQILFAGSPVKPAAVAFVNVPTSDAMAGVPGLQEEFFAPVLVVTRLARFETLTPEGASDLPQVSAEGSCSDSNVHALGKAFVSALPEVSSKVWGNLVAWIFVWTTTQRQNVPWALSFRWHWTA
jgi:hypothetical protein